MEGAVLDKGLKPKVKLALAFGVFTCALHVDKVMSRNYLRERQLPDSTNSHAQASKAPHETVDHHGGPGHHLLNPRVLGPTPTSQLGLCPLGAHCS